MGAMRSYAMMGRGRGETSYLGLAATLPSRKGPPVPGGRRTSRQEPT